MGARPRAIGLAALLIVGGCGSSSSSSTSVTASSTSATASPTTTAPAATTTPSTTTTLATTTSTSAAPTTTAAPTTAVAPPTSAPSPGAPAWEQVFATAAREGGNTVVWADDPGGLAVGHPGEWMLVNTSTDETVTADIDATVIGVRPAAGDKFAVITATTDGNAEVLAVSADGSVDSLGTIPGNGTSSADGMLLTAATVTPVGTALYVLVGRQSGGAFPPAPTMAKVQDGVTHPLGNPPGFGPITLDDAGHLIITSPADGRFPSQDGNRWTSADGASWTSISVPQQFGILLGFTAQSVLAFDGRNPPDVGVVDTAGTMTEQFTADESKGWLVVADDGDPHATLVGVATGIGVTVDRTTGAAVDAPRTLFAGGHGTIVDAWTGSDHVVHGLAFDPSCTGTCPPSMVLDSAEGRATSVDGCSWSARYQDNDGAMGHEYTIISLTNAGSAACPVPTVAGVSASAADGTTVTATADDGAIPLQPPPASVAAGQSVQLAVGTTTAADFCDKPSRQAASLTVDIGVALPVALDRPVETACQLTFTQPGVWQ